MRGHTSYEDTSEVVDAIVESGTPLDIDAYAHDIIEFAPELAKSSVSNQISRYSFATPLIENNIEHETVDFNVLHLVDHPSFLVLSMILWLFQSINLLVSHLSSCLKTT